MIQSLDAKKWSEAGGKANGLNQLFKIGLTVPPGLVISNLDTETEEQILLAIRALPNELFAVRSSADVEDGVEHSYAGQFKTFLDLGNEKAILSAIQNCQLSKEEANALMYHAERQGDTPINMNVLVQQMITAKWSGVIFSVNPVSNRYDQLLINVVEGPGEALVSGETDADQIELYHHGKIPATRTDSLPDALIEQLRSDCLFAQKQLGYPLDMEFVIDQNDTLWWLQARPITTLRSTHLNELDSPIDYPDHPIYTLGNVGEMMPGAITPLTWSVFGHAVEFAIQDMYKSAGVINKNLEHPRYMKLHYGRMFFDLQAMYDFPQNILLAKKENIDISLTGTILSTNVVEQKASKTKQLIGLLKNIRYNNSAKKRLGKLRTINRSFSIPSTEDLQKMYTKLTAGNTTIANAWADHMCVSANSGALYTALLGVLSGDPLKTEAKHHVLATQLIGEIQGIEGADMLVDMEALLTMIRKDVSAVAAFTQASHLLSYLTEQAPVSTKQAYSNFIHSNGHRGVREAALRSKDWKQDPMPLIDMLYNRLLVPAKAVAEHSQAINYKELLADYSFLKARIIRVLLPKIRLSIVQREEAKSLGIKIQRNLKMAYLHFAQLLVKQQLLDDSDQIFFLQHHELGNLITDRSPTWKKIAEERRTLYPQQMKLEFDHIMYTVPIPKTSVIETNLQAGQLLGTPVSLGKVAGRAFVASSLEDCRDLKEGDVLITEITDIGWTPYFGKIGGLVTEIGSPLSHGAVVAREYGLPAVVSCKDARRVFKTGDWVVLDAFAGTVGLG